MPRFVLHSAKWMSQDEGMETRLWRLQIGSTHPLVLFDAFIQSDAMIWFGQESGAWVAPLLLLRKKQVKCCRGWTSVERVNCVGADFVDGWGLRWFIQFVWTVEKILNFRGSGHRMKKWKRANWRYGRTDASEVISCWFWGGLWYQDIKQQLFDL